MDSLDIKYIFYYLLSTLFKAKFLVTINLGYWIFSKNIRSIKLDFKRTMERTKKKFFFHASYFRGFKYPHNSFVVFKG